MYPIKSFHDVFFRNSTARDTNKWPPLDICLAHTYSRKMINRLGLRAISDKV